MAAGLSDIIDSLNLAELVGLMEENYELHPEIKPLILQRFEEDFFNAEIEENLDAATFSDVFNQKLDILLHIYQQDPEMAGRLHLLRPPKAGSAQAIPLNPNADILESEEVMLERAIALSLIELSLIDSESSSSNVESEDIPSLWQEGVSIKRYLLEVFSQKIQAEAAKGDIDRRRLALLLPRLFTPNQVLVKSKEDGQKILDQQYSRRIPANILKRLELLSKQVLHIVNADKMPLPEKIINIAFLYQLYEKELRIEVEKLFLDEDESSQFINILLKEVKLSEKDRTTFTRELIRQQIINTYLLMCFQFMNVKIQYRISEQTYEYNDIIITSIGFISQQLQLLANKEILTQVVINRVRDHLMADKENGQGGWKNFNALDLKKQLVKDLIKNIDELSALLHANPKYEPIIAILSSVNKTEDYEKYCTDLVLLLHGMLPPPVSSKMIVGNKKGTTELSKKILSLLPGSDEKSRKKAAHIINSDSDVQHFIREAAEVVSRIKLLESEWLKRVVIHDDALKQITATAAEIAVNIPTPSPVHSAPAAVSTFSFGGYRARGNAALASNSAVSSSSSSSAVPQEGIPASASSISTMPMQHSAPAAARLDSAGSHRRYAFVGQASEVASTISFPDNPHAENPDTPKSGPSGPG